MTCTFGAEDKISLEIIPPESGKRVKTNLTASLLTKLKWFDPPTTITTSPGADVLGTVRILVSAPSAAPPPAA